VGKSGVLEQKQKRQYSLMIVSPKTRKDKRKSSYRLRRSYRNSPTPFWNGTIPNPLRPTSYSFNFSRY